MSEHAPSDGPPVTSLTGDGDADSRYRQLIQSITDYAIFMLDPDGIVSSWNPGAERFKGYKPNEIIGQHFSVFYSEADRARGVPQRALETARTKGKFESEGWRYRKDGTRFWAFVVIDPIRREDGSIAGYAKITRDLTERRAAEEALRRSQEQFRLLVQGVTDYAIYMIDENGIVTNWNPGAQRIKGYRPDEIIGHPFSTFYTPEDRAAGVPLKMLETARRDGRVESEGWRMRQDGSRFWAHVIMDAIRDDQGKLVGFAKITRDVTERKKAEEELEQARRALMQSQKMEAIGQLTGGVAHDFNNLLMAVLGSLELLAKRLPDDPKSRMLLDNARHAAERGATLTRRLLAFARMQHVQLRPVDIPALVRDMADLLHQSARDTIKIETQFPLTMKPALADANEIEMALLNLVVNARDAMANGGTIVISSRVAKIMRDEPHGLKAGEYVVLSVRDTGHGMNAEVLRRATEPFFTTKGVGKGTGLGLAMVHGIAEQAGGRLHLISAPGQGTTAELWLPVAKAQAAEQTAHEPAPQDTQHQRRLVILAVDDDPLVLLNTVAMLEDLGHGVIPARSGQEALQRAAADDSIELVITDQVMPEMTGTELIDLLKQQKPSLHFILASGYAEFEKSATRDVHRLAKPFTQAGLAAAVAPFAREMADNVRRLPSRRKVEI